MTERTKSFYLHVLLTSETIFIIELISINHGNLSFGLVLESVLHGFFICFVFSIFLPSPNKEFEKSRYQMQYLKSILSPIAMNYLPFINSLKFKFLKFIKQKYI